MTQRLSERVEALSGPDREVDAVIFRAIEAPLPTEFAGKNVALTFDEARHAFFMDVGGDLVIRYEPPAYTASIDDAMTLVPEGWEYTFMNVNGYDEATLTNHVLQRTVWAGGQSLPISLTAAALRARGL